MNQYIELLEQIVLEMNQAPKSAEISEHNLNVWRGFLKQIKPESKVFDTPFPRGPDSRTYSDVRDIMILAEVNRFPVWHIRLKPKTEIRLEYIHGRLRTDRKDLAGVPKEIPGFTGCVSGAIKSNSNDIAAFVACDMSGDAEISAKIELLKTSGFVVSESILFPTERIKTISSLKLETFFRNYLKSMEEQGFEVNGATIFSDSTICASNGMEIGQSITFTPE